MQRTPCPKCGLQIVGKHMPRHVDSALCIQRRVEREFAGAKVQVTVFRLKEKRIRVRVRITNPAGYTTTSYQTPFEKESASR
jgi:hypothetical protein